MKFINKSINENFQNYINYLLLKIKELTNVIILCIKIY